MASINCSQTLVNNTTTNTTNLMSGGSFNQCLPTGKDVLTQLSIKQDNFQFDVIMVIAFTGITSI